LGSEELSQEKRICDDVESDERQVRLRQELRSFQADIFQMKNLKQEERNFKYCKPHRTVENLIDQSIPPEETLSKPSLFILLPSLDACFVSFLCYIVAASALPRSKKKVMYPLWSFGSEGLIKKKCILTMKLSPPAVEK